MSSGEILQNKLSNKMAFPQTDNSLYCTMSTTCQALGSMLLSMDHKVCDQLAVESLLVTYNSDGFVMMSSRISCDSDGSFNGFV